MAQPVFDSHPLEIYLREMGEAVDPMPGGAPEFDIDHGDQIFQDAIEADDMQWLPSFLFGALDFLRSILPVARHPLTSPFVERFKYDVISSSLLSSDLTTPPNPRHQASFNLPGRLSTGHSRAPSTESNAPLDASSAADQNLAHEPFAADLGRWPATIAFAIIIAIYSAGHYVLAALALGLTLYCCNFGKSDASSKPVMTSSLGTLKSLIEAGDVWDSVVHEGMSMLESEEQSIFYGPANPASPSSSVRVALQSSLHTTQIQCDNIRQLFSALTSPTELSQLSEMYAPPSPVISGVSSPILFDSPRPLSFPTSHNRSNSSPSRAKRSTWNGSYSSLASAGSPTMQVLKRREKRRSDLTSLAQLTSPMGSSVSAPPTPDRTTPSLTGVQEEDDSPDLSVSSQADKSQFGVEALDLQRKRKASGMEALGLSLSGNVRRSSMAGSHPSSRFTTMQTSRHPLSLSALNHALQGAVASKRYACSHLLALRFNEEEDEGYWEDVRSVMSLLTTIFVDASSRLTEALEDAEKQKLQDQTPSLPSHSRNGSTSLSVDGEQTAAAQMVSFAPLPSHLSRFAAHVDAISSALDDARVHLKQCVASLREHPHPHPHLRPHDLHDASHAASPDPSPLAAYERMRRELGLALRECERGRERLLHILAPARPATGRGHEHDPDADPDSADDLPALGHDLGSDESDRPDSAPDDALVLLQGGRGGEADDATAHLLLAASAMHLPPQGIEQVFEAESGAEVVFARGRSKMTREERIRAVKARREGGAGFGGLELGIGYGGGGGVDVGREGGVERWGPGGEVVQELKDVIWKVGERRRRMTDRQFAFPAET